MSKHLPEHLACELGEFWKSMSIKLKLRLRHLWPIKQESFHLFKRSISRELFFLQREKYSKKTLRKIFLKKYHGHGHCHTFRNMIFRVIHPRYVGLTHNRSSSCYSLPTTIVTSPPTHKLYLGSPKPYRYVSSILTLHDPSERFTGHGRLWMPQSIG